MRAVLFCLLTLVVQWVHADPPEFAPVRPGVTLSFPRDFGAHPEFRTEWWYATGWVDTPDGKPLGFQVTFFRSRTEHDPKNPSAFAPRQLVIGHAALSDPELGRLVHDQRSAREGFSLAWARTGNTDLKLDDWRMVRESSGAYRVTIRSSELTLELRLEPTQPVLVQGEGGYSRKGPSPQHASHYYSEPQLKVSGKVGRTGSIPVAVTGSAWLDHEWSSEALQPEATGWDWIGVNLNDGGALMAFQIRAKQGGKLWAHATHRDAAGKVTRYAPDQVNFTPTARWKSPRTDAEYPVATLVTTGPLRWQITPLQQDQELDSRRSTGAVYWEGAVTVGRDGKQLGRGYLEMTGYVRPMKL
ncbi:lipocalin-like domain-containing protein [Massilia sp. 9I]|uniref:lipocalin-like domain-containing protein n=1 Tax=Massilia sp. 9I TaxID=2653152 RepID=UPI0012F1C30D|nr:carotenoid 1,2-hydratase [Massilia sp. 9I]VXB68683.1 AttH component of AttEFGH ABC transport system [Massilia sp. 9I]